MGPTEQTDRGRSGREDAPSPKGIGRLPAIVADARLIAAAPDHDAAAREAVDFIRSYFGPVANDDPDGWSDADARAVHDKLCAAIAKAAGNVRSEVTTTDLNAVPRSDSEAKG